MPVRVRVILGRLAGVLAIMALPAFVFFGWGVLPVAVFLALVASWATPKTHRGVSPSRLMLLYRSFERVLHPHSWRPGGR